MDNNTKSHVINFSRKLSETAFDYLTDNVKDIAPLLNIHMNLIISSYVSSLLSVINTIGNHVPEIQKDVSALTTLIIKTFADSYISKATVHFNHEESEVKH